MYDNIFYKHISKDPLKLEILRDGLRSELIESYDPEVLTKLRRIYYSFYSGILYLYGEPTTFNTIANKIHILSYVFEDEDYNIVHGNVNSTKEIRFNEYNSEHLDYNSWIEVKKGNKTYVYDTFSMMKFDKDIYYQLENPEVFKKIPKEVVKRHPERYEDDYTKPRDTWMLVGYIPRLKKELDKNPYKDILIPELTRYLKEVNYEDIVLDWKREESEIHKRKN